MHRLQSSSGGKRPTTSTLSLVLDSSHSSMISPVHVLRNSLGVGGHQVLGSHGSVGDVGSGSVAVHDSNKLMVKKISKLIHLHAEAANTFEEMSVMLLNLSLVLHPNLHPEAFFLTLSSIRISVISGINFAVLQLPGLPLLNDSLKGGYSQDSLEPQEAKSKGKLHFTK